MRKGMLIPLSSLLNGINDPINKIGVTGPITLTAVFVENDYLISTSVSGGGSVTGANTYSIHDIPTITAVPDPGWEVSHIGPGDINYLSCSNCNFFTSQPRSSSVIAVFRSGIR